MRRLDRWLLALLAPLWALALLLSGLSLDRPEVVSPFRVEGAPGPAGLPRVTSFHPYAVRPAGDVEVGDLLLRIGDEDLRGASAAFTIGAVFSEMERSGAVRAEVLRDGARRDAVSRIPATIPKWPTLLVSLVFGGLAVFGLWRFPAQRVMQVAFPALMAMAIWTGSYFGRTPTELLAAFGLRCGALLFLQPLTARLMRHYPDGRDDAAWARGWPALLGVNGLVVWDDAVSAALPAPLWELPKLLTLLAPLLFAAIGIDRYRRASRSDRRRFKWLLFGVIVGATPGAMVGTASAFRPEWGAWFLPSQAAQLVVPVCLFIAIWRHQLFDIDRLLNVTSVAAALVVLGLPLVLWLGPAARTDLAEGLRISEQTAAWLLGAAGLALAVPVGLRLWRVLDGWVRSDREERDRGLQELLEGVSSSEKVGEMGVRVAEGIASVFQARGAAVWVRAEGRLTPIAACGELPGGWEEVAEGRVLDGHRVLEGGAAPGGAPPACRILVGPARSGEPYTPDDGRLLALVVERLVAATASLEQRELLEQARAANRELGEQRVLALRESEEKSRLIATASHDLRQPLQALRLFLGSLEDRLADAESRELVAKAQQSAVVMQQSFEALLDLTRLDAGVLEVRVQDVPLDDAFAELHAFLEPLARAKGVELRVQPGGQVARSDPALLRSILQNLVSNAIRYTDAGHVAISARSDGTAVVIEVADTGRGLGDDTAEILFEPWRRGAAGAAADDRGAGLGLAIVARLAERLGHALEVESGGVGRGSTFRLRAEAGAARAASQAERVRVRSAVHRLEGLRVLVLEDDRDTREALVSLLDRWGVEAIACDRAEGSVARCGERAPDAALLDQELPDGTGLEVFDRLAERFGPIPAALLSASSDPDVASGAALREIPLLRKPVSPVRVRALLTRLVARDAG